MKIAVFYLTSVVLLVCLTGCGRNEDPPAVLPSVDYPLHEIAALKRLPDAEAFVAAHGLPHSRESLDTMRQRAEQIPSSAIGSSGRFSFTIFLDQSEAVAHVDFYHDAGGHVLSTIIHLESVNKP